MTLYFKTNQELEHLIGERVKAARLSANMSQQAVSIKGGVSLTALKNLESGKGCTLATLVATLRAIEQLDALSQFLPELPLSPILLRQLKKERQRAGKQNVKRD